MYVNRKLVERYFERLKANEILTYKWSGKKKKKGEKCSTTIVETYLAKECELRSKTNNQDIYGKYKPETQERERRIKRRGFVLIAYTDIL